MNVQELTDMLRARLDAPELSREDAEAAFAAAVRHAPQFIEVHPEIAESVVERAIEIMRERGELPPSNLVALTPEQHRAAHQIRESTGPVVDHNSDTPRPQA